MQLDRFKHEFKRLNGVYATEKVVLFRRPLELYSLTIGKVIASFDSLDDALRYEINGKTLEQRIGAWTEITFPAEHGGRGSSSGAEFNGTVNPFAAGLYDYSPSEQKAVMIRELYYKGGSNNRVDNEAYYKMLYDLIGDCPIQYIIIDPPASSMIETIQKYGKFMVVKADNDVLNGIQDVTKFLNAGCLYFHKSCKSTFEEFETYSWDEEKAEDAVIKENDHSMDQLRYFCRTALRGELKWVV